MKLTRLQLLLILAVLGAGGYYGYAWWQSHAAAAPVTPTPEPASNSGSLLPPNPAPPPMNTPPIPKISKTINTSSADGSYTVVKGDTLWRIAEVKSPVHQGPGWVTIWQANKDTVKNFDRLEVGWNLTIPATPQAYVMRYWKPRNLAQALPAAAGTIVDLRQLPAGAENVLVDLKQLPSDDFRVELAQLPVAEDSVLVDLRQLPTAPEMALAEAVPEEFTASAFRRPVEGHFGQPQYFH